MPKSTFRVVVRHGNEALVRPPFEVADKTDANASLTIKNPTGARLLMKVPANLFQTSGTNPAPIPASVFEINAGQQRTFDLNKVGNGAARGLYSLPIFCEESFSMARASSDPEFIVE